MIEIVNKSDFKIKITSIKDNEGNILPIDSTYLYIEIADNYGNIYICEYIPNGESRNVILRDGSLFLIVENYKLLGCLKWSIGTKNYDDDFIDNYCNWFTRYENLCINIINK